MSVEFDKGINDVADNSMLLLEIQFPVYIELAGKLL